MGSLSGSSIFAAGFTLVLAGACGGEAAVDQMPDVRGWEVGASPTLAIGGDDPRPE